MEEKTVEQANCCASCGTSFMISVPKRFFDMHKNLKTNKVFVYCPVAACSSKEKEYLAVG